MTNRAQDAKVEKSLPVKLSVKKSRDPYPPRGN
jgi:hypothetical protein